MIRACSASPAGVFRAAIIRKPEVSMPSSQPTAMCWLAMSASVDIVASRMPVTPWSRAARMSSMVPMPGSSTAVRRALRTTSAAASIHARSPAGLGPKFRLLPARPSPWPTSMEATPAASRAAAMSRTCSVVYRCRMAWLPSRRVTSWT
jgi:hypothetical protein